MIYATEEQAFRRVETLKARGVWPGVRYRADGTFEVTYDPDVLGEVAADLPGGRDMGSEGRAGGRTQRAADASSYRRLPESTPPKVIQAGMERVLP